MNALMYLLWCVVYMSSVTVSAFLSWIHHHHHVRQANPIYNKLELLRLQNHRHIISSLYKVRGNMKWSQSVQAQSLLTTSTKLSSSSTAKASESSSSSNHSSHSSSNHKKPHYFLDNEILTEIKESVDLVQVIESYNLPRFVKSLDGQRATALCPFHDDNNPSLNVDNYKGIYKCFACGAGGDVFNFVRQYDSLTATSTSTTTTPMSFLDAVQYVVQTFTADSFNISSSSQLLDLQSFQNRTRSSSLTNRTTSSLYTSSSYLNIGNHWELKRHKQRILLANSAAADFYAKLLITLPSAGIARLYLVNRGIQPSTVRTFALGYAPDAYFTNNHNNNNKDDGIRSNTLSSDISWGRGSLVQQLQSLNFTPIEILDAGLATITSKARYKLQHHQQQQHAQNFQQQNDHNDSNYYETSSSATNHTTVNNTIMNNKNDYYTIQYSDLIDRFRNRLMVPIFDASGKDVIAFGGRILNENHLDVLNDDDENIDDDNHTLEVNSATQSYHSVNDHLVTVDATKNSVNNNKDKQNAIESKQYTPAKYINSPETLVFSKKSTLFALHSAQASLPSLTMDTDIEHEDHKYLPTTCLNHESLNKSLNEVKSDIIIVEGYFDAISLYNAGFRTVTASMGAALSISQIVSAADTLGQLGGKIILCLDNDQAGISAIERLCSTKVVWEFLHERENVDIVIAVLPDGVKDPAEYLENNTSGSKAAIQFQTKILDEAQSMSDWYISRVIHQYNSTEPSTFSLVCDRISTFLSFVLNDDQRSKIALQSAKKLADVYFKQNYDNDSQEHQQSKSSLQIQLESDFITTAVKKMKGISSGTKKEYVQKSDAPNFILTNSYGSSTVDDDILSFDLEAKDTYSKKSEASNSDNLEAVNTNRSMKVSNKYRNEFNGKSKAPIIDHFSGFQFKPTDATWLGIDERNTLLVLGNEEYRQRNKSNGKGLSSRKDSDIVYFNSNQYLGQIFPFSRNSIQPTNKEQLDSTHTRNENNNYLFDNPLLRPDAKYILLNAENRLLKTMIEFPPARIAMKIALQSQQSSSPTTTGRTTSMMETTGMIDSLEFTTVEKKWLFHSLTGSNIIGHYENDEPQEPLPIDLLKNGTALELYQYFTSLTNNVPEGAFSKSCDGNGSLQYLFFEKEEDSNLGKHYVEISSKSSTGSLHNKTLSSSSSSSSISLDISRIRSELTVQEAVSTMLRANALKRLFQLKDEYSKAIQTLTKRREKLQQERDNDDDNSITLETAGKDDNNDNSNTDQDDGDNTNMCNDDYPKLSNDELQNYCLVLSQQVMDAMRTAHDLSESTKRLGKRLLDYSISSTSADGVEGRILASQQENLVRMLEEHIASLPEDSHRPETSGDDGEYIFGSDAFSESGVDFHFGGRAHQGGEGYDDEVQAW